MTSELLHTALIEKNSNLNSGVIFKGILLKFGWYVGGIVFYEQFWRRGALALTDRYAHRKFQIDTTPNGDAIRVSRNLETPTYKLISDS